MLGPIFTLGTALAPLTTAHNYLHIRDRDVVLQYISCLELVKKGERMKGRGQLMINRSFFTTAMSCERTLLLCDHMQTSF